VPRDDYFVETYQCTPDFHPHLNKNNIFDKIEEKRDDRARTRKSIAPRLGDFYGGA